MAVWDMTYTSSGYKITGSMKAPSNGSVAGMSSMPGTRFIGTLNNVFQDESTGPDSRSSPDNFIKSFELGMSKAYSYPLASQMTGRPSLLAQVRTEKVITKIPVAAVWLLVIANLLYAMLGFGLALWALVSASPVVHQIQMRLGVAGLSAALFDKTQFERLATTDDRLFEENGEEKGAGHIKRIGVKRTQTGGSAFTLH